jgi:hypothetical protein
MSTTLEIPAGMSFFVLDAIRDKVADTMVSHYIYGIDFERTERRVYWGILLGLIPQISTMTPTEHIRHLRTLFRFKVQGYRARGITRRFGKTPNAK